MAVAKRYCIQDAVTPYTVLEPTQADTVRGIIFEEVFNDVDLKAIFEKIVNLIRVGKDPYCEVETLFYLEMLVEYFQIVKEETVCTSDKTFDELSEEYKFDCIRNILTCRFGLGNLIEELIEALALRTPYNGISYMSINYNSCNPFKIHGVTP